MAEGTEATFWVKLREELAAIEHERWSHWQSFLHSMGRVNPDGSMTLPQLLVEKWERQIALSYQELDEDEKESDREQVDRYLPLLRVRLAPR